MKCLAKNLMMVLVSSLFLGGADLAWAKTCAQQIADEIQRSNGVSREARAASEEKQKVAGLLSAASAFIQGEGTSGSEFVDAKKKLQGFYLSEVLKPNPDTPVVFLDVLNELEFLNEHSVRMGTCGDLTTVESLVRMCSVSGILPSDDFELWHDLSLDEAGDFESTATR